MRVFGGLRPWVWQRLTAVLMAVTLVAVLGAMLAADTVSLSMWRGWFSASPTVTAWALLFFVALHWHAWIGLRDIVLDYIHRPVLRVLVLALGMAGLVALMLRLAIALFALHGIDAQVGAG